MNATYVLPRIAIGVPRCVVPPGRARANAGLAQFLVAAGALTDADIPATWSDALDVCQRALEGWVRRQIGPLHCLSPMFVLVANEDGDGAMPSRSAASNYPSATLCWLEREERQWVVGAGLEALEQASTGLGAAVLDVLQRQHRSYPLFTPDMACDAASYLYWYGEGNEQMALDEECGDDEDARAEMREQMVTSQVLAQAYPAWARRGSPRRRPGLQGALRGMRDRRLRGIVEDALALSRLRPKDDFRPDIDGEFIAWGALLSWQEDDVTVRIYDDLINMAHQGEFCDRIGEVELSLDQPALLADWRKAMHSRFKAIGLIDRLIHALSAGDWT